MRLRKKREKIPKFFFVGGTKAHGSLDTHIHQLISDNLEKKGFESRFLGVFEFKELPNGDRYILKHERRGAWKYKYTASQTDAEGIIFNIYNGIYPKETKGQLTGHLHNAEGTIIGYKGIDVICIPSFVAWLPYPRARTMMHYYQSDVGAYILIVTKDGRNHWQEWLYRPFIYQDNNNSIIQGSKPNRTYVSTDKFDVSPHFKKLLEDAIFVAVAISDTHTGEKEAPCPETYTYKDRQVRKDLTRGNYRMNSYWYHLMYMIKYVFKADEVWHLGDGVAGTNPFEKYRNPLMVNLHEEVAALVELCNALTFDKKTLKKLVKKSREKSTNED